MKILLIEDDTSLCASLEALLLQQGFEVSICADGEEGLFYLTENAYDLALLDRMLPKLDGMEVLKRARQAGCMTPVIFLTALGALDDRVSGLDCGADDYLVKPFAFEELLARIRCIARRPQSLTDTQLPAFGDLSFDPAQSILRCARRSCTLSKREGALLLLFLHHPNQVLPRGTILARIWGPDSDIEEGNLDNYIHFLRRRLRAVESRLELKTVRGIGYQLTEGRAAL